MTIPSPLRPLLNRLLPSAAAIALAASPASGSDAMLLEDTIDIQTGLNLPNFPARTLYRSKKDKTGSQFYYLPTNIRFALDQEGRPMLTLYKYDLSYNNGNFVPPGDTKQSETYQGGTLKATFSMGLRENELETLKQALIKEQGIANPKIGRLPLTKAEFTVSLTDPANPGGPKVLLGPFPAPVSADIIAVQEPLSKAATDIFYAILTQKGADGKPVAVPDAPINILMNFSYAGYGLDSSVTVTGEWENLYKASETKMSAKGSFWFVSVDASYEDKKSQLVQDAAITITYDGDVSDEIRKDYDTRVMDRILEQAFDLGGLSPSDKDNLGEDAGKSKAPDGQTVFGRPAGIGLGFARKAVSREKKGKIFLQTNLLSRIDKEDARYGVLDMRGIDKGNAMEITPSDWSVPKVLAEISPDVAPWFGLEPHVVNLTYKTDKGPQTFPKTLFPGAGFTDFGNFPKGNDPKVEIHWGLRFASWKQIKEELDITTDTASASYNTVVSAMTKFYQTPQGAAYSMSGDLRLMSGISLSSTALPLKPVHLVVSPIIIGPDGPETVFNWYDPANLVALAIEQDYTIRGTKQTLKTNLGFVPMTMGSVGMPNDTLQAFTLEGEGAGKVKLVANSIIVAKKDGSRVLKQKVVLDDDLQSGSVVILLDDILR